MVITFPTIWGSGVSWWRVDGAPIEWSLPFPWHIDWHRLVVEVSIDRLLEGTFESKRWNKNWWDFCWSTLPKFNSSPLKSYRFTQKEAGSSSFPTMAFRGELLNFRGVIPPSPFPGCWLVTTRMTWNIFRIGDPELNLHLPQASWEGGQPKSSLRKPGI